MAKVSVRRFSYGKTYEQIYGAQEARRLRVLRFAGLDKGASTRGKTYEEIHGVAKARELRELRSRSLLAIREKETNKDRMEYVSQFRHEAYKLHSFDFMLCGLKILLEVDGCYWHGCKIHYPSKQNLIAEARDKKIASKLRKLGWVIVRLWEHAVLSGNFTKIWSTIIRLGRKGKLRG